MFLTQNIYFIILLIMVATVIVQTLFLWGLFASLAFYKKKEKVSKTTFPVSIVVSARNEAHHLDRVLPSLLEQQYPEYEVVLVNDHSKDDTEGILKIYQAQYPHLKVINLKNSVHFFSGKKFPLSIGIKSAKYEHILLTDADCKVSEHWVQEMQQAYQNESTELVLSYGAYEKQKGILNKLIRYYAFFTAEQYLSFAAIRLPYMGIGRNLSYTKSLFYKQNGFISHYNTPSGDDDLFVNKAATSKNTEICLTPESFTYSQPKTNLSAWFRQKRRHISTGKYYKQWQRWSLSMYPFSLLVMLISGIFLLSIQKYIVWVSALLAFRYLSFYTIQYLNLKRLKENDLWLLSPLWELLIFAINTLITLLNTFLPRVKWK